MRAVAEGLRSDAGLAFGYLRELAEDPKVTDIAVTGDGRVWADAGAGMKERRIHPGFTGPAMVREYAVQLSSQLGRRLDDSCPIADASTVGGIRIHAVIPPLVAEGASISIRLPDRARPGLVALAAAGLCPAPWVGVLKNLVAGQATLMVTGGTGAGKTTLLKALLGECRTDERIVSVEEVRELGALPGHGDHVSLAAREANVEGAGAVGLPELIKATLRMRPDRIILGECRGEEVADLLRAFNSGHHGGMVTLHADGVGRVPSRLATLGLLAGLDPRALAALTEGAFDAVIHLERSGGRRRIAQIGLLGLDGQGRLTGRPVCTWDGSSAPRYGDLWPMFADRWGITGVVPSAVAEGSPGLAALARAPGVARRTGPPPRPLEATGGRAVRTGAAGSVFGAPIRRRPVHAAGGI
ncbi:pilus assembly protein [Bifidobacterium xylocopae]|uniref:Pilus assembly protein n=1 Tax=Bifidobacterium xylocopae TaxID=2493119 RepID=A0A366KFH2_9BIFI|nr:ATPase, T2SS/T4P/T4SS family [Bifidobacterium xylocopae]RBP99441.1 pilus assembly protein [Bifidobacterium xylocopae]